MNLWHLAFCGICHLSQVGISLTICPPAEIKIVICFGLKGWMLVKNVRCYISGRNSSKMPPLLSPAGFAGVFHVSTFFMSFTALSIVFWRCFKSICAGASGRWFLRYRLRASPITSSTYEDKLKPCCSRIFCNLFTFSELSVKLCLLFAAIFHLCRVPDSQMVP